MRIADLPTDELRKINAYWRAADYLSVGQIYLSDNPLLRQPLKLDHIKPRLLGHWGTTRDFFTNLQAEIDRGRDSVFTETQRTNLRALFDSRDDAITLLARSDPASADRLLVLYVKYRQALGTATH